MNHPNPMRGRVRAIVLSAAAAALLSACGGNDVIWEGTPPPASCSVADQKDWLRSYMQDWYFWYQLSPNPAPAPYADAASYFNALLYTGTSPDFPADRWSYVTSTEAYQRFYENGQTLGYGLLVAGLEVTGHPEKPLYARYIEPNSPAALAGLARGDQILSVNGRSAADMIAANDYSALSATVDGENAVVQISNASGVREVTLMAAVYDLKPVPNASVMTTPQGHKLGYLMVKDMAGEADWDTDDAFNLFRQSAVTDLVIDLRYNGGGLVAIAAAIASYPAAPKTAGSVYANLIFNNRHGDANGYFAFSNFSNGLNLSRVYVLTGPRTCSASEQLINSLRPFIDVVTVGDTTCGKPVGFTPQDDSCGSTYSAVTFESTNSQNQGRYFDGFPANCAVSEDFSKSLGDPTEPLLAAAVQQVDGGACPAGLAGNARSQTQAWRGLLKQYPHWLEPGERQGMITR